MALSELLENSFFLLVEMLNKEALRVDLFAYSISSHDVGDDINSALMFLHWVRIGIHCNALILNSQSILSSDI